MNGTLYKRRSLYDESLSDRLLDGSREEGKTPAKKHNASTGMLDNTDVML